MLVPNFNDTFFTSLVSRIEQLAAEAAYQVIVVSSQDDAKVEASRLDALMGWRPSGIIAVPATNAVPQLLRRESASLPIILVDCVGSDRLAMDTVKSTTAAGRAAAEHLIAYGHRAIAIASSVSVFGRSDRIRGVAEAAPCGLPAPQVITSALATRRVEILMRRLDGHPHPPPSSPTNVTTWHRPWHSGASKSLTRSADRFDATLDDGGKVPLTAVRQPLETIADRSWEN